jgi:ABC-type multidrug transport system fused ATPase/permease subunit
MSQMQKQKQQPPRSLLKVAVVVAVAIVIVTTLVWGLFGTANILQAFVKFGPALTLCAAPFVIIEAVIVTTHYRTSIIKKLKEIWTVVQVQTPYLIARWKKFHWALRRLLEVTLILLLFGVVEGKGALMIQLGWGFILYLGRAYGPVEPLVMAEVGIYLSAEVYIRFCRRMWARYLVAGVLAVVTLVAALVWSGILPLPIPFIPVVCIAAGVGALITGLVAFGQGRRRMHIPVPVPVLLSVTGKLLREFTIDGVSRLWSTLTLVCMSVAVYSYTAMLLLNSALPQDFLKGRGVFVGQLLLILLLSFNVAIVTGSMSLFHNLVGRRALRRLMRQLMAARLDGSATAGAVASLLTQLASLILSPTEDLVNMAYPLFLCSSVFIAIGVKFVGLAVVAAIGVFLTLALNFWIGAKIQAASTSLQASLKQAQNEVLDVATEEAVETIRQYGAAPLFEKRFAETTKRSGFLGIARRMLMRGNLFQVAQIQNLTAFAALFLLGFHMEPLPASDGAWLFNWVVGVLNAISLNPATAASAIVATAGVLNYLSTYVSQISQSYGQWVNNIALYDSVFVVLRLAEQERSNLASQRQALTPQSLTSLTFDMSLPITKLDELTGALQLVKTVNVDGTLAMGQVVGIVGPSGVGKSMILRSLYGVQDYEGTIRAFDEAGLPHDLRELGRGTLVLMTFQDPPAFSMAILENLLVERFIGNDAVDIRALATQSLEQVGLLSELTQQGGLDYLLGTRGSGVSGGQRMRIAIARALLLAAILAKVDPTLKLVFAFDESTGPLDKVARKKVMQAFQALARQGHLVLLVVHHLDDEEGEEGEDLGKQFDSFLQFVPTGQQVEVRFVKTV